MPNLGMTTDQARAILDAISDAVREGHPPPHRPVWQTPNAKRVGIVRLGYKIGSVNTAYLTAIQLVGEPDWDAVLAEREAERRAALTGEVGSPPIPPIAKPPPGFVITHNSGTYDADGNLKSQSVKTRRDAGEKYEPLAGHEVRGESALLDPDGRVLARWIKTHASSTTNLIKGLREAFAEYQGGNIPSPVPVASDDDLLTFYPLPDLHIGMYAWGAETGMNYDTDIAVADAKQAIASLVADSKPSKRAVVLGMGDYFHSNDAKGVTPGSGHKLDVDGRWQRVYAAGAKLATSIIEIVAAKHPHVEVAFLPGNHDPDAAATLTVAMALFYANNPSVVVCENPGTLWFYRFGKVLLGATHGDKMRPSRMAQVMAHDCAEDWGRTTHRHFFFGHVHHVTAEEVPGVIVESFSAPVAKDAYAAAAGYRARRRMTAITFHRERGEQSRHHFHLPAPRVRVKAKSV